MSAEGEDFYNKIYLTAQSWTADAAYDLAGIGSSTTKMLVRSCIWDVCLSSASTWMVGILGVVKYRKGSTAANLNDNDTIRQLKNEGRLFYRRLHYFNSAMNASTGLKTVRLQFRNVSLEDDEVLAVVWIPYKTVSDGVVIISKFEKSLEV